MPQLVRNKQITNKINVFNFRTMATPFTFFYIMCIFHTFINELSSIFIVTW